MMRCRVSCSERKFRKFESRLGVTDFRLVGQSIGMHEKFIILTLILSGYFGHKSIATESFRRTLFGRYRHLISMFLPSLIADGWRIFDHGLEISIRSYTTDLASLCTASFCVQLPKIDNFDRQWTRNISVLESNFREIKCHLNSNELTVFQTKRTKIISQF